jgi:hypothetical protein
MTTFDLDKCNFKYLGTTGVNNGWL